MILNDLGFTNLDFGEIQSVDEMTILPILGDNISNNVSKPEKMKFKRTDNYGTMRFENEDDEGVGIIPSNFSVMSDYSAQDHAMSGVGLIESNKSKSFNNACCVQETQGGMLRDSDNMYEVLPLELRKVLLSPAKRNEKEYNKLWSGIKKFLKGVPGVSGSNAHLEYFFNPFRQELEDFAAEFEPVESQLGAIVFFGGIPVGIEVMPTVGCWNYYWKLLVRGCYGSQLLKLRKLGLLESSKITFPDLSNDHVSYGMDRFLTGMKDNLIKEVDRVKLGRIGNNKLFNSMKDMMVKTTIDKRKGGGDIIREENKTIYASLCL